MLEIIFINYRRADDLDAAGRLYDALDSAFTRAGIFIDVDNVAAGSNFASEIVNRVNQSEQHLDLLSFATGDGVGLGLCNRAGLVASGFVNGARDLACGRVWAALRLERAGLAVVLAREVDHRAFFGHSVAWLRERAMIFPQLFAAGANIAVALRIEGEVGSRERAPSVRAALSISFTCGSIPRSSTSHPIISAEP